MSLSGDNQSTLADALGISTHSLSFKLNGKANRAFTLGEIKAIRERYNLSPEEITEIFFD